MAVCSGMSRDDKGLMSCVRRGQGAAEALQLFQFWSEVVFWLIIPTAYSHRMRSRAEGRSMPIIFRVRNLIKPDQIQGEYKHSLTLSTSRFCSTSTTFSHFVSLLPKVILSEYMVIMK